MFDRIKNESGVAFAMVLILLILVGGLAMALLNSNVFNIRHSGNQVDRAQAFQAADSGIEYLKSRVKFEINQAETNGEDFSMEDFVDGFSSITRNLDNNNEISFTLSKESNGNDNRITFKSVGDYRGQTQTILYDFRMGSDKPFQIQSQQSAEDLLKGQEKKMYDAGYINVEDQLNPPNDFWFYSFEDVFDEDDNLIKRGLLGQDEDENYYLRNGKEAYEDFMLYQSDTRRPNMDDDDMIYYEEFNGSEEDGEILTKSDFYGSNTENEYGYIDSFFDDYQEFFYNAKRLNYKHDDDGKKTHDDGQSFSINENEYFTAFVDGDISIGRTGSGNIDEEDEWERNIINTILVVDGDIDIRPQIRIENSIIVARGSVVKFTGAPTEGIINSLFYSYADVIEFEEDDFIYIDGELHTAGNWEDWEIDDLPDFGNVFDVEKHLTAGEFEAWRQSR